MKSLVKIEGLVYQIGFSNIQVYDFLIKSSLFLVKVSRTYIQTKYRFEIGADKDNLEMKINNCRFENIFLNS